MSAELDFDCPDISAGCGNAGPLPGSPRPARIGAPIGDLGQGEPDRETAARQITSSPPGRQTDVDVAKRYRSLLDVRPDMVQGPRCVMNVQSCRPVT